MGSYLTTIGLALWWFDTRHPLIIKILTPITASGVVFSAYFVYLQLGVIGEICPFCMLSAAATVLLFGLELLILRKSQTPSLLNKGGDLGNILEETNIAVVLFPVLSDLSRLPLCSWVRSSHSRIRCRSREWTGEFPNETTRVTSSHYIGGLHLQSSTVPSVDCRVESTRTAGFDPSAQAWTATSGQ